MDKVMATRWAEPLRAVFVLILTAALSSAATLAFARVAEPPSSPRAKPAVPDDLPGLSRSLSKSEKALQRAIRETLAGKTGRPVPAGADPLAGAVLEWILLTRPESQAEFARAATFIEAHPEWPRRDDLLRTAERALGPTATPELTDAARLGWFRAYHPVSARGAMAFAGSLIATGHADQARELLADAWRHYKFGSNDEKIFLEQFGPYLTRDDQIARLDRLLYDRQRSAAKRQARRLGAGYPELAGARLALAFRRPGVDSAIGRVPPALTDDVGLLYERIRWRYKKRRLAGVLELLDSDAASQIDPDRLWPIRAWATRQLAEDGDLARAYAIVCRHGLTKGSGFAEAQWLSGWYALRSLGRPEDAMAHFQGLHAGATSPISRARGAYWVAQAAVAAGDKVLAARWLLRAKEHGTAFYGQRAAQELGTSGPMVPKEIAIADSVRAIFLRSGPAKATALLHRLGFDELAETFILHMAKRAEKAQELSLVAELARQLGRLDLTLKTAKIARTKGHILHADLFPGLALSPQAGPEPALVLAVIRQESAFDPGAVSRAGARGLMQLLPSTAKIVARRKGERYVRNWLTEDPDYNTRLGRAYLQSLIERYGGTYVLALAAYNAGPHRVDRWLAKHGDPRGGTIAVVDWIERIPFSETRNYVQRVLEGMFVYRAMGATQLTWKMSPPGESS